MPIRVEHQPSPTVAGIAAYSAGRNAAKTRQQKYALDLFRDDRNRRERREEQFRGFKYREALQNQYHDFRGKENAAEGLWAGHQAAVRGLRKPPPGVTPTESKWLSDKLGELQYLASGVNGRGENVTGPLMQGVREYNDYLDDLPPDRYEDPAVAQKEAEDKQKVLDAAAKANEDARQKAAEERQRERLKKFNELEGDIANSKTPEENWKTAEDYVKGLEGLPGYFQVPGQPQTGGGSAPPPTGGGTSMQPGSQRGSTAAPSVPTGQPTGDVVDMPIEGDIVLPGAEPSPAQPAQVAPEPQLASPGELQSQIDQPPPIKPGIDFSTLWDDYTGPEPVEREDKPAGGLETPDLSRLSAPMFSDNATVNELPMSEVAANVGPERAGRVEQQYTRELADLGFPPDAVRKIRKLAETPRARRRMEKRWGVNIKTADELYPTEQSEIALPPSALQEHVAAQRGSQGTGEGIRSDADALAGGIEGAYGSAGRRAVGARKPVRPGTVPIQGRGVTGSAMGESRVTKYGAAVDPRASRNATLDERFAAAKAKLEAGSYAGGQVADIDAQPSQTKRQLLPEPAKASEVAANKRKRADDLAKRQRLHDERTMGKDSFREKYGEEAGPERKATKTPPEDKQWPTPVTTPAQYAAVDKNKYFLYVPKDGSPARWVYKK